MTHEFTLYLSRSCPNEVECDNEYRRNCEKLPGRPHCVTLRKLMSLDCSWHIYDELNEYGLDPRVLFSIEDDDDSDDPQTFVFDLDDDHVEHAINEWKLHGKLPRDEWGDEWVEYEDDLSRAIIAIEDAIKREDAHWANRAKHELHAYERVVIRVG